MAAREPGQKTLTKADIVESVHEKVGFSKKESSDLVELVFESMKKSLERRAHVKISGFGKFEVRHKNTRRGRDPQRGVPLEIPERWVLTFKASEVLKRAMAETPPPPLDGRTVSPSRSMTAIEAGE